MENFIVGLMAAALLSDVLLCAFKMGTEGRRAVAQGDFTAHVKCDRCGREYDVTAEEYAKPWFVKERSVTKTEVKGGALVNRPKYRYYGRRFECPYCKKKHYAQVLNCDEIFEKIRPLTVAVYIRWGIRMVLGGIVIMAITGIAMKICEWLS